MRVWIRSFFVAALLVFGLHPADAGVNVIQAFDFGEFTIKNNNSVHTITVGPTGSYSFSGGFLEISPPQEGIFDITGLDMNRAVSSVVVTQVAPLIGGGESFQLTAFTESHPGSTDASGVLRVNIGATLQSSGNGLPYNDQLHLGTVQIQVNY